jgi:hypothetical protein
MKNILLYIPLIMFVAWACDNRKDPYADLDNNPSIKVKRLTDTTYVSQISDSVKLGQVYVFNYQLQSFTNLKIDVQKSNAQDSLTFDNNLANIQTLNQEVSSYLLRVVDPFNKTSQALIQLTVFRNLPPICRDTVFKVNQLSPYEIEVDASKSFDQDARWGGKILKYEYHIDTDYSCTSERSSINYICVGPGQKKISVRVQDNDGVWSDFVVRYFMLN